MFVEKRGFFFISAEYTNTSTEGKRWNEWIPWNKGALNNHANLLKLISEVFGVMVTKPVPDGAHRS